MEEVVGGRGLVLNELRVVVLMELLVSVAGLHAKGCLDILEVLEKVWHRGHVIVDIEQAIGGGDGRGRVA